MNLKSRRRLPLASASLTSVIMSLLLPEGKEPLWLWLLVNQAVTQNLGHARLCACKRGNGNDFDATLHLHQEDAPGPGDCSKQNSQSQFLFPLQPPFGQPPPKRTLWLRLSSGLFKGVWLSALILCLYSWSPTVFLLQSPLSLFCPSFP